MERERARARARERERERRQRELIERKQVRRNTKASLMDVIALCVSRGFSPPLASVL